MYFMHVDLRKPYVNKYESLYLVHFWLLQKMNLYEKIEYLILVHVTNILNGCFRFDSGLAAFWALNVVACAYSF